MKAFSSVLFGTGALALVDFIPNDFPIGEMKNL
jgi:hypothetical protein